MFNIGKAKGDAKVAVDRAAERVVELDTCSDYHTMHMSAILGRTFMYPFARSELT